MKINVTDAPNPQDEEYVIDSLWAHNSKTEAVDIHPLFLTVTDDNGEIVGGLVARTWWEGLKFNIFGLATNIVNADMAVS